MNQVLEWQQTPHTSPSRASYGVSVVRNMEKFDRDITTPHCSIRRTISTYTKLLWSRLIRWDIENKIEYGKNIIMRANAIYQMPLRMLSHETIHNRLVTVKCNADGFDIPRLIWCSLDVSVLHNLMDFRWPVSVENDNCADYSPKTIG